MNPWADTSKPWPIRPVGLKDIQLSWIKQKQLERLKRPLEGAEFLELFWEAARQLRDEGIISWKSKEVYMFNAEQEDKFKELAFKKDLSFNLRMLAKAGAYLTLNALNLAEKPFDKTLKEKTIRTIASGLIQCHTSLYALGGEADAPIIVEGLLQSFVEEKHA